MEGRRCVAEVLAGIDENINYYEQGLHWAKNNPNVNYKCAQSSPCHSRHDAEQTTICGSEPFVAGITD